MRTQTDRIVDFLATGKSLTPIQALRKFGCMRLGARAYDLRKDGHDIRSEMVSVGGKRIARYRLVKN